MFVEESQFNTQHKAAFLFHIRNTLSLGDRQNVGKKTGVMPRTFLNKQDIGHYNDEKKKHFKIKCQRECLLRCDRVFVRYFHIFFCVYILVIIFYQNAGSSWAEGRGSGGGAEQCPKNGKEMICWIFYFVKLGKCSERSRSAKLFWADCVNLGLFCVPYFQTYSNNRSVDRLYITKYIYWH